MVQKRSLTSNGVQPPAQCRYKGLPIASSTGGTWLGNGFPLRGAPQIIHLGGQIRTFSDEPVQEASL